MLRVKSNVITLWKFEGSDIRTCGVQVRLLYILPICLYYIYIKVCVCVHIYVERFFSSDQLAECEEKEKCFGSESLTVPLKQKRKYCLFFLRVKLELPPCVCTPPPTSAVCVPPGSSHVAFSTDLRSLWPLTFDHLISLSRVQLVKMWRNLPRDSPVISCSSGQNMFSEVRPLTLNTRISWVHLFDSDLIFLELQTRWLSTLRDSLWSRGLSSEVRPLTSERTGSEFQQAEGLRSEAAVFWTGESKLSTGDSEVRSLNPCSLFRLSFLLGHYLFEWSQFCSAHCPSVICHSPSLSVTSTSSAPFTCTHLLLSTKKVSVNNMWTEAEHSSSSGFQNKTHSYWNTLDSW